MCSKSKFQVPILKMYIKRGSETYVQIMCSMSKVRVPILKIYLKRGARGGGGCVVVKHRQELFVQSPRFESSSLICNLCLNLIGAPNANQLRNCAQVLFLNKIKEDCHLG